MELTVEKLSLGGDGVARKDGLVYFIPFAVPGDVLQVKITEKKKNFARAEITEIIKSGPGRQKAPCPVFGKCGGCNWQQLSYDEQLLQKNLIIKEQLRRVADEKTEFLPIIPSPKPLNYRNRIQLKYDGKNLGFYARGSHQIVSFNTCWISDPKLNDEIQKLKQSLGKQSQPKIELFLDQSGKVNQTGENTSDEESFGFSQVNTEQNSQMVKTVLNWIQGIRPQRIFDLYAGAGNFSFPFSENFPSSQIIAVELNSASVRRAKSLPEKSNLQFHQSDVGAFLKNQKLTNTDFIFLDPPRIGCTEDVIQIVAQQKAHSILYVSCNPSALARDIGRMQAIAPWKIARVQPFDMFPQTDHIETLVELKIDT